MIHQASYKTDVELTFFANNSSDYVCMKNILAVRSLYIVNIDTMKKQIKIDVASFYLSDFKELSWHIEGGSGSDTSTLEGQQSSEKAISQAVEKHLQQIGKSLPASDSLSDYEMSLAFSEDLTEQQKEDFTAAFNDSNTRDESY